MEKKNWTVAQWSKVLFSDESKLCISFGNQGPRVWRKSGEAQNPCCLKSSVKFPQSVMIWAAMSSAGVGPLCFLKSNQIKSLLLSHHHSTSALVSEILESVLQTVQKNKNNLHIDSTYLQTVQKTMCKIHIHILNIHYKDSLSYQYTMYTFYIMYTSIHSNMLRCNRL